MRNYSQFVLKITKKRSGTYLFYFIELASFMKNPEMLQITNQRYGIFPTLRSDLHKTFMERDRYADIEFIGIPIHHSKLIRQLATL